MIVFLARVLRKYKIFRGMLSYAIMWSGSSLVHQTLVEQRNFETYDWKKVKRFALFGSLYMAPMLYGYIAVATQMFPTLNVRTALSKVLVETFFLDPYIITSFHMGMKIMEGESYEDAKKELAVKFLPTYKLNCIYWPSVQMINYTMVPVRNQVVYTSVFSFVWTSFLAYMQSVKVKRGRRSWFDNIDYTHQK